MKKVLIITYYWPPSGGAGVQRWVKFAKYLKYFDYEPIVITVDSKYASYPLLDTSLENETREIETYKTKSFEPFGIYKRLLGRKDIPFAGFANEKSVGFAEKISRFIRGNFFIPDARKGWNRYVLPIANDLIKKYNIETVITTSPPHSTNLIGLKLKRKFNIKWIVDLRDPWTDIYYYDKLLHTGIAKKIDKKLETNVLNTADSIIVVSESIKKLVTDKLDKNLTNEKVTVIPNGFDGEDFQVFKKKKNRRFTITYTGTLAENYKIDAFLDVLSSMKDFNIQTKFIGKISPYFLDLIREKGLLQYVEIKEHVEHADAIRYMINSDMLLLAIPHVPENRGILTGKLFEYLASKNRILGIGPVDGDAAKIIRYCQSGNMFDYKDVEGIKSFIDSAFYDWENDITFSPNSNIREFSRMNLTKKLIKELS